MTPVAWSAATVSTDAETVVVALGSVVGTLKDTVDALRADDMRVGILGISTFRPFPTQAVREALGADRRVRQIVVLERAFATGMGGIVSADLRMALAGHLAPGRSGEPVISTVIAGLGGRAITQASVRNMLTDAAAGALEPLSFLDLRKDLVRREPCGCGGPAGPGRGRRHAGAGTARAG